MMLYEPISIVPRICNLFILTLTGSQRDSSNRMVLDKYETWNNKRARYVTFKIWQNKYVCKTS